MRTLNALNLDAARFQQTEDSALVYTVNWSAAFPGETISTSTWSVIYGNATLSNDAITGSKATVKATVPQGRVVIANTITTSGGQLDTRLLIITAVAKDTGYQVTDYQ